MLSMCACRIRRAGWRNRWRIFDLIRRRLHADIPATFVFRTYPLPLPYRPYPAQERHDARRQQTQRGDHDADHRRPAQQDHRILQLCKNSPLVHGVRHAETSICCDNTERFLSGLAVQAIEGLHQIGHCSLAIGLIRCAAAQRFQRAIDGFVELVPVFRSTRLQTRLG